MLTGSVTPWISLHKPFCMMALGSSLKIDLDSNSDFSCCLVA